MKTKFLLVVILSLHFLSCKSDSTNSLPDVNPYYGHWKMAMSGNYQTAQDFNIIEDGSFTYSFVSTYSFEIQGIVNNSGEVSCKIYSGNNLVGTMSGQLKSLIGNGNWSISNESGTWTAGKYKYY
jgi:hypothetical protein